MDSAVSMPRRSQKTKILCVRFPEAFAIRLDWYIQQTPYLNMADLVRAAILEKIRRETPGSYEALMTSLQPKKEEELVPRPAKNSEVSEI